MLDIKDKSILLEDFTQELNVCGAEANLEAGQEFSNSHTHAMQHNYTHICMLHVCSTRTIV